MLSFCQDFNNTIAEFLTVLRSAETTGAGSLIDSDDSRCLICDQHDEFIKAMENLEATGYMTREDVVAATPPHCLWDIRCFHEV